ncbi:putative cytochrome P450 [Xylariaceae sp. FL0594]|nr:putative cytochrome P450 [Xylariaceae sp. FL0594]
MLALTLIKYYHYPVFASAVALVVFILRRAATSNRRRHKANGPRGLPIIGNLHQIPSTGAHRRFTEWSRTYGGLFMLRLGPSTTAAVITDRRLVKELVDKRSSIFSDRPASYVSHDLITRGDHLLVMRYDETWRTFRKILHRCFNEGICDRRHLRLVDAEQTQMMRDFAERPEQYMLHPRRTSNSIVMGIVYGVRSETVEAPHLVELYDIMDRWSEVMEVGATPPVDFFPVLKYLPESLFNNWVQRSLHVGQRMKALYSTMRGRVSTPSPPLEAPLLGSVMANQEKLRLTPNQLDFLGGVLMEGGSDTVSTMMLVVIQAMTVHRDVQKRAQAQIDAVCGEDRSPVWADYDKLPYVSMIIKEAMRWRPVTPLGFPHALSQDYHHQNDDDGDTTTFLPKGTTVFLNVWGLHHDESVHPNPDRFDPDRYEGRTRPAAEYAASADPGARDHYTYGFGRRICPGIHLAERELFLGVAKLLWGFDFAPQIDATTGRAVPIDTNPETGYSEGFLVCPKPFPCVVKTRSSRRRETILAEYARAEAEVFSKYTG